MLEPLDVVDYRLKLEYIPVRVAVRVFERLQTDATVVVRKAAERCVFRRF